MDKCTSRFDTYNTPCPYAEKVEGRPYSRCTAEGGDTGEQCADYRYEIGELMPIPQERQEKRNEEGNEMNKCPSQAYAGINCPYALSSASPLPCFGSPEQCKEWRAKLKDAQAGFVDKSTAFHQLKQEKKEVKKVKVDSPLYGIEVDDD